MYEKMIKKEKRKRKKKKENQMIVSHLLRTAKWDEPENRKKFFEDYAKSSQFDPNLAEEWRQQHEEQIMSSEVSLFFPLLFVFCYVHDFVCV